MPAPILWGSELLLNTTVSDYQGESSLAALADGRFVAAWSDYSQAGLDASFYGVRAQLFNADGSKSGAEFQVNSSYDNDQRAPSVTALANGRFAIAWTDGSLMGQDRDSYAVRAQLFNTDGSKFGIEFQVNTTATSAQWKVSLEALNDGRFVAVWDDYSQSGADVNGYAIRGQIFNPDGSKSGAEFLVNTTTDSDQTGAHVTTLLGGAFVVAWSDYSQSGGDSSHYAVRAQMFNIDGSRRGNEFLVNTTTDNYQGDPRLSATADGGLVAVWADYSQSGEDSSGYTVRAQRFDVNGAQLGSEFAVPSLIWGDQFDPYVVTLADGRFLVAWTDFSGFAPDFDRAIRAQVFQADGTRDGDEFLLASTTTGDQQEVVLTLLADGRLMTSWTDFSSTESDTSVAAIRGQIFDPRETAIRLTGTALADQWVGTPWSDTLDGGAGIDTLDYQDKTTAVQVTLNGPAWVNVSVGGVVEDRIRNIENIVGGSGNDVLVGDALANSFTGGSGNDALRGNAGNDTLDGGAGIDRASYLEKTEGIQVTLNGSTLVNVSVGGVVEDRIRNIENIVGGSGNDLLVGDALSNSFTGGAGNDAFRGNAGNDTLDGGAGIDRASYLEKTEGIRVTLNGSNWVNVLVGGVVEDRIRNIENIVGGSGNDLLIGDALANSFNGGFGNDTLNGGSGLDRFVFSTALGSSNIDTLTDFQTGTDKIVLDDDIFTALGVVGTVGGVALGASRFHLGAAATDTDDRIVYNQATGQLFYDADGSGAGAQQQIALIGVSTHAALALGDFLVVA